MNFAETLFQKIVFSWLSKIKLKVLDDFRFYFKSVVFNYIETGPISKTDYLAICN